MNTSHIVKICTIIISSLILLVIIGITAIVTLVDPNKYKSLIIQTVNDATNRKLSLDGSISWTVWPNLGLHIEKISLSNPKEFKENKLINVKSVDVSAELIPLLRHSIIIDHLAIDGLSLALLKSGELNNWTFNSNNSTNDKLKTSPKVQTSLHLELDSFKLNSATITYRDLEDKSSNYAVIDFNLIIKTKHGGVLSIDKDNLIIDNVEFNFSDSLKGYTSINLDHFSNPKYSGNINITQLNVPQLLNKINYPIKALDNMPLLNLVAVSTKFNGDCQNMDISNIDIEFGTLLKTSLSNLKIRNLRQISYTGDLDIHTFSLNSVMEKLGLKTINIPNKQLLDKISIKSRLGGSANKVTLSNITGNISNINTSGNIDIKSITPLKLNHEFKLDHIDMSDIVDANGFKIPLTDINLVGSIGMNGSSLKTLNANQNLSIQNITILGLDLDDLVKQLDASISNGGKSIDLTNLHLNNLSNSIGVVNTIKTMQNAISKAKSSSKDTSKKTDLGIFSVNALTKNGIANPVNFKLRGKILSSDGQGSINLVKRTLSYTVKTKIQTKTKNDIINIMVFPYDISGNFNNTKCSLDWVSIQKQLIEYLLQNSKKQTEAIVKSDTVQEIKRNVTNSINRIFNN